MVSNDKQNMVIYMIKMYRFLFKVYDYFAEFSALYWYDLVEQNSILVQNSYGMTAMVVYLWC